MAPLGQPRTWWPVMEISLVQLPHPLAWHSRSPGPGPDLPLRPYLCWLALPPAHTPEMIPHAFSSNEHASYCLKAYPCTSHPEGLSSEDSPRPHLSQSAPLQAFRTLVTSPIHFPHHQNGVEEERQLPLLGAILPAWLSMSLIPHYPILTL